MSSELAVILHGGGGKIGPEHGQKKLPYLRKALDLAWAALVAGKPGEFAVVEALRVMEGCEYFNAGYGGYPNVNGIVLLDVGLMRGDRDFVSLIHVRRVKYPSSIALDMLLPRRTLLSTWTHELMMKLDEAPEFIKGRYGLVATHEDLVAPFVKQLMKEKGDFEVARDPKKEEAKAHGTVGCVVRDAKGEICAGTSTGGVSFKYNGRVGDSPIIGAGVFADNEICGLSTT